MIVESRSKSQDSDEVLDEFWVGDLTFILLRGFDSNEKNILNILKPS